MNSSVSMFGNKRRQKAYSREEIIKLMDELPSKIEYLLRECVGRTSYFIPDYATFNMKATELLKPFFEYSDAMFHAGIYSDVFRSAVRVFAAKKMEYERRLPKSEQQLQKGDKAEAIDSFMRFKLLFSFFGYTEQEYLGGTFQIFDLEYRLDNEKDPHKRRELLEDISKIVEESSTGLYAQALVALNEGDLDRALALCEQAIEKFPGNTPVYKLKADILQAIAKKTIEEGLQQEPRDQMLLFARDLENRLWELRENYANGRIDLETVIKTLEQSIQKRFLEKGIKLRPYEQKVKESLLSTAVVKPKTMTLLCTGEFLLSNLLESLDYAASAIEFCKAVENELLEKVFKLFRAWCRKNLAKVAPPSKESREYVLYGCVYKNKEFTLGSMAMLFQFLGSKKALQKCKLIQELKKVINLFPEPDLLLGPTSIRSILTPEAVNNYRNSSAHLSVFTSEKAKETKSWCYKILNLLARSTNRKKLSLQKENAREKLLYN